MCAIETLSLLAHGAKVLRSKASSARNIANSRALPGVEICHRTASASTSAREAKRGLRVDRSGAGQLEKTCSPAAEHHLILSLYSPLALS